jgi:hypothetical protein
LASLSAGSKENVASSAYASGLTSGPATLPMPVAVNQAELNIAIPRTLHLAVRLEIWNSPTCHAPRYVGPEMPRTSIFTQCHLHTPCRAASPRAHNHALFGSSGTRSECRASEYGGVERCKAHEIGLVYPAGATISLADDTDFIDIVEAESRDGSYLEQHATDATACLAILCPSSWHTISQ